MTKKQVVPTKAPRALLTFVQDKRREKCPVCALPEEVRQQIREARDKKVDRRTIREWLKSEYGREIPETNYTTHSNGHHDDREAA